MDSAVIPSRRLQFFFSGRFLSEADDQSLILIELDDGNILTGNPKQFDGKNIKNHGFPVKIFPTKPIH